MQDLMRLHVPAVNNTKKLQNITVCFLQLILHATMKQATELNGSTSTLIINS